MHLLNRGIWTGLVLGDLGVVTRSLFGPMGGPGGWLGVGTVGATPRCNIYIYIYDTLDHNIQLRTVKHNDQNTSFLFQSKFLSRPLYIQDHRLSLKLISVVSPS
jgi:hypothetical protein